MSMSRTSCSHRLVVVYCIWEEYDAACPVLGLSWLWVWEEFPIFGWRLLLLMAARQMQPVELLLEAVVQATATVAPLGVATTVPAAAAAAAETVEPNAMWVSAPWANRA